MSLLKDFLLTGSFLSSASSSEDVLTRMMAPGRVPFRSKKNWNKKETNWCDVVTLTSLYILWTLPLNLYGSVNVAVLDIVIFDFCTRYSSKPTRIYIYRIFYILRKCISLSLILIIQLTFTCGGLCDIFRCWTVVCLLVLSATNFSKDLLRFSLKIPCVCVWVFVFMMADWSGVTASRDSLDQLLKWRKPDHFLLSSVRKVTLDLEIPTRKFWYLVLLWR